MVKRSRSSTASSWCSRRTKLCCLALTLQCLVIFGSLVPESEAFQLSSLFGGGKKEETKKGKGKPVYEILRGENFEKHFDGIKASGTKEVAVVLMGLNAEQDKFAPTYRKVAKKFQGDPTYTFYRLNLISEQAMFELPEKQYGPFFDVGQAMGGRYFHILLIRDGEWKQAAMLHMGFNRANARELEADILEKELELRRGDGSTSNVLAVKAGQAWEDLKHPGTWDSITIVGYIPDRKSPEYAFFDKVAVSKGGWTYPDLALYYHTADKAFIKSMDADLEVDDAPAVYVHRKLDGWVTKVPLVEKAGLKEFREVLHRASFPKFMDRSGLELMKVYGEHPLFGDWFKKIIDIKRSRLEFVAPVEKWLQVSKIANRAMEELNAEKEHSSYFIDVVFMHKATPNKYSYGEITFKLLNDTREVVPIVVSQAKTTATKTALMWRDDTCCNTVEDLTVEKVKSFMISVGANEIQPFNDATYGRKSERAPYVNKGPLFKVVGTTFDAFVNSGKNVLIYFFAKSNEASVAFEKNEMKDIAAVFKNDEDVTIGKINGAKNRIKDSRFKVDSYPDLYFINTEMEVIRYEGMYLKEDIIEFVRKQKTDLFTKDKAEL